MTHSSRCEECCGNCKYHVPANPYYEEDGEFICDNQLSDYYSDFTEWGDVCTDYEEKE